MSHVLERTEDNTQDWCVNCGMTGNITGDCPQPKDKKKVKSDNY